MKPLTEKQLEVIEKLQHGHRLVYSTFGIGLCEKYYWDSKALGWANVHLATAKRLVKDGYIKQTKIDTFTYVCTLKD